MEKFVEMKKTEVKKEKLITANGEKHTSFVWEHFVLGTKEHKDKARCKTCESWIVSKHGTTALKKHLETHSIFAPAESKHAAGTSLRTARRCLGSQTQFEFEITRWLCVDMRPIACATTPAFKRFMEVCLLLSRYLYSGSFCVIS